MTGSQLVPNGDVVVVNIGNKPTLMKNYSKHTFARSVGECVWGIPIIGTDKMRRLRSVLTGEWFDVIGVSRNRERGTLTLAIDRVSVSGESCSGYLDEFGRIWTLSGKVDLAEFPPIFQDSVRLQGRKIVGATLLCGPLGNRLTK